jgi:hypothetical protein
LTAFNLCTHVDDAFDLEVFKEKGRDLLNMLQQLFRKRTVSRALPI